LLALPFAAARAADTSKNQVPGSKAMHATISKIDSQHHTLTVKTAGAKGEGKEKTLQLASDIKFLNSAGKPAKADSFKAGDSVCVREKDGKVTELHKEAPATITKVDAKAGTIAVKMTDENGKQVEETFHLVEDSEYIDSSGRVAVLDVFRSGDDILLIEMDGRIKSMKKDDHKQTQTGAVENGDKQTKRTKQD
jgi:hypothetical protein